METDLQRGRSIFLFFFCKKFMSHVFKPPPSKVDYFQILQIFKNIGNICIRYTKLIKLIEYLLKFHVSSLNRHVTPDFVGEQVYEMDHMFTIH